MRSIKLVFTLLALSAEVRGQFLPIVTAKPSTIPADSDATKITISGSDFVPGLFVKWNGQPRITEFLDQNTLRVTLTADDLAAPSLGTLTVWDPSLGSPLSDEVSILVYLPLQNNDLVYDAVRERLYVAVSQEQRPHGQSIAVLNPTTARVERYFPLEADPEKLAISADSRYLYAAVGNMIRRIDLLSWSADLDIPLGSDTLFGSRHVLTMVVLPRTNTSLAVSFRRPGLSPAYLGTAVFDGAQMRSGTTPGGDGPAYLIGGPDDNTLHAADSQGTFYSLKLTRDGISVAQTVSKLCGGDGDPVLAGGLVYTGWGAAIDPAVPTVIRTFGSSGPILALPDLQAVLILGGDIPPGYVGGSQLRLTLVDAVVGHRIWSIAIPAHLERNRGPLIRWGTNGIAFRDYYDFSPSPSLQLFRVNLSRSGGGALLPYYR